MLFVGIDVGNDGGIVAIDKFSNVVFKSGIPTEKERYDHFPKIFSLFKQLRVSNGFNNDIIVCIEDVHSLYGMSAKSNFSFGGIKNAKVMASLGNNYQTVFVSPKVWQKAVWIPEDVVLKEDGRRKDAKATSLNAAKRLWPGEDFRKSNRARKQHDGIVDSALIAEYCRIVNT